MLWSLREQKEGKLQILLSPRKNGLDSLFKDVRLSRLFVNPALNACLRFSELCTSKSLSSLFRLHWLHKTYGGKAQACKTQPYPLAALKIVSVSGTSALTLLTFQNEEHFREKWTGQCEIQTTSWFRKKIDLEIGVTTGVKGLTSSLPTRENLSSNVFIAAATVLVETQWH